LCHSAQKRNGSFGCFDEHKTYHLVIFHIKTAKKLLLLNGEIFLNMHNLFCKFSFFCMKTPKLVHFMLYESIMFFKNLHFLVCLNKKGKVTISFFDEYALDK